jgi:hypothetical protein
MIEEQLPVEVLECQLRKRFESAQISLDPPGRASGVWYLDITDDGHHVVIGWREDAGFGVSSSATHGYGEGADEVYPDLEAAYGRVVSLLLSRTFTSPSDPQEKSAAVKP